MKLEELRKQQVAVRNEMKVKRSSVFATLSDRDGAKCSLCGSTQKLQIDHILPVCNGGTNELSNLRILCKKCNINRISNKSPVNRPCTICGNQASTYYNHTWYRR